LPEFFLAQGASGRPSCALGCTLSVHGDLSRISISVRGAVAVLHSHLQTTPPRRQVRPQISGRIFGPIIGISRRHPGARGISDALNEHRGITRPSAPRAGASPLAAARGAPVDCAAPRDLLRAIADLRFAPGRSADGSPRVIATHLIALVSPIGSGRTDGRTDGRVESRDGASWLAPILNQQARSD
jgi:hypothetical protein